MIYGDHNWGGISTSFFSYLVVHSGRKAFTNTRTVVIDVLGMSPEFAGILDAQFMLAYAIGLVTLGSLGDRHNPATLLATSLVGMALLQVFFSEMCSVGVSSDQVGEIFLSLVWIADGFVQSLAWPCCVKIVQNSMSGRNSSTLFSFWACNGIMGNITSSILASIVMHADPSVIGFRLVFLITSLCNIALSFLAVRLKPITQDSQLITHGSSETQIMTVGELIRVRGVIDYSLCHACIKAVAYAMFFWLPYYLVVQHSVSPSAAASLSIIYDLATLVGGPCCGYLVERTQKPSSVIAAFVILAAGPQLLINGTESYGSIPTIVVVNIVLAGFFVGGVLNVLSAAVCAKLGGRNSTSTVTGVIDGAGSLGASLMQILIPLMSVNSGWEWVFGTLSALLILSAFTLTRIIIDEWSSR
jgi:sugar phosphate permease